MAAYLDSDENFMMYRRFGWIQARLLLRKQKEISDMEKDLEVQDGFPVSGGPTDAHEATCQHKEDLLEALESKFTEYSRLLGAAREMMRMQRPSTSEYRNLRHYFGNNADEIDSLEDDWSLHQEDIVTLRPGREHAWLDVVLEKLLQSTRSKVIRSIFCSQEKSSKSTGPIVYYTRSRIDALAAAVITVTILILLVIPTYVLYHLTSEMSQGSRTSALSIGVLLIFTLAFSAVLSLFTRARRHEILAAAAAYCAVLVVFLGNIPDS
ncbi:hypothetical protein BK809_0007876 [Diplodia seriata]|uniref:DUF6594 domain-containing protein n=1 Tax=Diplodia seriata TaxID=420778 RepID=A0A1S8BJY5_9PEZI|nr:hypothetical protein BK809_0007876 [Diplodia seriata]